MQENTSNKPDWNKRQMHSKQYDTSPTPDGVRWDQLQEQGKTNNSYSWGSKLEKSNHYVSSQNDKTTIVPKDSKDLLLIILLKQ